MGSARRRLLCSVGKQPGDACLRKWALLPGLWGSAARRSKNSRFNARSAPRSGRALRGHCPAA
eukprot:13553622-Alexandrium_andersonii.AAC.1